MNKLERFVNEEKEVELMGGSLNLSNKDFRGAILSMSHGSEFIVGLNNAVYTPVSKIKIMDDVFRFIEKNPCVFKGYSIHQIPQSQIESRQFQDYIKNSDCTQEEVLQVYKLKEN